MWEDASFIVFVEKSTCTLYTIIKYLFFSKYESKHRDHVHVHKPLKLSNISYWNREADWIF